MVVAALLNVSASVMNGGSGTGYVDFFHGFQVALMMTIMLNLVQFVYWRCKASRRGTCWQKFHPVFWTFVSAVLTNVQPFMILLIGSFHACCSPCDAFPAGGLPDGFQCPASGKTFPPWGDGAPRECFGNGNAFWDQSYCQGKKLPTFPTKLSGWMIQVLCTWGGFVFMFYGIMEATQLHKKFAAKWRQIQRGR